MPCLFNLFLWIQNRDLFAGDSFSLMFTTLDSMLKISVRLHVVVAIDADVCVLVIFLYCFGHGSFCVQTTVFFRKCKSIDLSLFGSLLAFAFISSFYLFVWLVLFSLHLVGLIPVCVCASIWFVFLGINRIVCILLLQVKRISKINSNCIVSVFIISCAVSVWIVVFFFCCSFSLHVCVVCCVIFFFFLSLPCSSECAVFLSISLYILVVFGEVPLTLHYITFSRWPGLNTGHCFSCVLFSYLFTSDPPSLSLPHISPHARFSLEIFSYCKLAHSFAPILWLFFIVYA